MKRQLTDAEMAELTQLRAASDKREAARNTQAADYDAGYTAGLEAAAKVCDERKRVWSGAEGMRLAMSAEAGDCAKAIRALAVPAAGARGGEKSYA